MCDDITFPIFDGTDYKLWRQRMIVFLKYKKCLTPFERKQQTADTAATYLDMDVKAMNYVYSALSNKQLEYVCELNSTFDIRSKLDQMYDKKSTALQILCRNNLESIKLQNFKDVKQFIDQFEKSANELKAAGATLSEDKKLNYMLKSLPVEYSYIGDLIDVIPKEEKTVEYLKSKIKLKSMEQKSMFESEMASNTFAATSGNQPCDHCGKMGHHIKNCHCYNKGHRGKHNQSSQRGNFQNQNRGNFQNNSRGNNRRPFRGRRGGQHRGSHPKQYQEGDNNNGSLFVATTKCNVSNTNYVNNKNQISFLLDSGCSTHIINNDIYFENSTILKEPLTVYLGDGHSLKATKVGTIKVDFDVYGQSSIVTIKNVFFVENMRENLLSLGVISQNNKVVSQNNLSKIYCNIKRKIIAIAHLRKDNIYEVKGTVILNKNFEVNANISKNKNETIPKKKNGI